MCKDKLYETSYQIQKVRRQSFNIVQDPKQNPVESFTVYLLNAVPWKNKALKLSKIVFTLLTQYRGSVLKGARATRFCVNTMSL